MEQGHPGAAQQKQYRREQESSELLQPTNQRHLQRQQRIAELRDKRLSMSSITTVNTSSSAKGSSFFTCSSPTASSSSSTSPVITVPTSPSFSLQENCPTNYRHSRRKSLSSVPSSLSEWHHLVHSNLPSNTLNPALPVPGSVAPIPAARRQQQQRTNKHKSQTSESDGPLPFPSRPNSFASSYQPAMLSRKNSQRSQQQRQLDSEAGTTLTTMSSHSNHQYEKESNAAFERICTLLTDLITDASTAVSTTDRTQSMDSSGAAVVPSIVIPCYLPIVCSESDNSDEEVEASYPKGGEPMMPLENGGIDGQESILFDEEANHPPESPRDQIRRRIDDSRKKRLARNRTGSYTADPSKRTSLFLELQNLKVESEGTQHPTAPVLGNLGIVDPEGSRYLQHPHHHLHHRHQGFGPSNSSSTLPPGIGTGSGWPSLDATVLATTLLSPATPRRSLDFDLFDSELGSPVTLTTPRRRASFPPRRSDRIQIQHAEELQWVIQRVDAELDRMVETIDGLTRDLMAVATHQNWMKALDRTLGIQNPLSLADILQRNDDGVFSQVAGAATGETAASPTSSTSPRGRLEQMEDIIGATKALLSSKEFANYYQVLERIRIMEQEEDCEEYYHKGGGVGVGSNHFGGHADIGNKQQRLSDSSFTLVNGSFRHSSSSTLSLDTRFGSYADFKDGALLTGSSRPSIEWSDCVGMTHYRNSSSHGLDPENIHPLAAAIPVHQLQHQHRGPASTFEPLSTHGVEPTGDHLPKVKLDQQKERHREQNHDNLFLQTEHPNSDHLSPDATLAISKLILACTHLFLLLFWTVTLFLGVVITDGSILDNASRQLISSAEVLQNHFTIRDDSSLAEQLRDDVDATLKHEQEQEQEQLETAVAGPAPKSSRPCSTRRRTRPSQRYHHNHHTHHHKHLHHRRLSFIFPQINSPSVFGGAGGGSIGGRFYNSPFLASSRYGVDISNKEPRAIQLGPLSVPPVSSTTTTTTTTSKRLAPVLPASLSSSYSCFSSVGLLEDSDLSISTASSSATLLDWLDSTAATSAERKEVQALLSAHNKIDTAIIN